MAGRFGQGRINRIQFVELLPVAAALLVIGIMLAPIASVPGAVGVNWAEILGSGIALLFAGWGVIVAILSLASRLRDIGVATHVAFAPIFIFMGSYIARIISEFLISKVISVASSGRMERLSSQSSDEMYDAGISTLSAVHDWVLIAALALLTILIVVGLTVPGNPGPNRFGPPPEPR